MIRLAAGDFRDRVRSPGFFLSLVLVLYLAYTVAAGYWTLRVGTYTGRPSSAWIGLLTALLTGTLLSWIGFYVARGSLVRDRESGVGELLAATSLTRPAYLLSKSLAAALLLVLAVSVLALGAAATAAVRTAGPPDLVEIVRPFLLFALPPICLAAGMAVVFDATPGLRGGFGNVLYFVVWGVVVGAGVQIESPYADLLGFQEARDALHRSVQAQGGDADFEGFSLTVDDSAGELTVLDFPPVTVDGAFVSSRFVLAAAGLLLPLICSPWASPVRRSRPPRRGAGKEPVRRRPALEASAGLRSTSFGERTDLALGRPRLGPMIVAELRLALRGWPWWWYAGVVGLWVAAATAPVTGVRTVVVPLTALWGALLWSPLGNRPRRHGLEDLLAATPQPVTRLLLATWGAGVVAAVGLFVATIVRLAAAEQPHALAVLLAGCLFVPTAAVALGEISGVPRAFEAAFVGLWYVGPLNGVPALDFLGVTDEARAAPWLLLAALGLAIALGARRLRLGRR